MAIAFNNATGLPVATDGTVQNSALSGGFTASNYLHINADGTLATNTVKSGSAFVNAAGWLINPDGSLVVSTSKQGGAFIGHCGALLNPDGSVVTSVTKLGGAFIASGGWLVNPDGTMVTQA